MSRARRYSVLILVTLGEAIAGLIVSLAIGLIFGLALRMHP